MQKLLIIEHSFFYRIRRCLKIFLDMEVNIYYDIMQAEQFLFSSLNPSDRIGCYVIVHPPAEVSRLNKVGELVHRLGSKWEDGWRLWTAKPNLKATIEPRRPEVEPKPRQGRGGEVPMAFLSHYSV